MKQLPESSAIANNDSDLSIVDISIGTDKEDTMFLKFRTVSKSGDQTATTFQEILRETLTTDEVNGWYPVDNHYHIRLVNGGKPEVSAKSYIDFIEIGSVGEFGKTAYLTAVPAFLQRLGIVTAEVYSAFNHILANSDAVLTRKRSNDANSASMQHAKESDLINKELERYHRAANEYKTKSNTK
jgi:hypothetical protein